MEVKSRFGEALILVWLGTAVGFVLGTAALATLFPDVPYGVEFVLWGAVLPAPLLTTVWIYRSDPEDDDARSRVGG